MRGHGHHARARLDPAVLIGVRTRHPACPKRVSRPQPPHDIWWVRQTCQLLCTRPHTRSHMTRDPAQNGTSYVQRSMGSNSAFRACMRDTRFASSVFHVPSHHMTPGGYAKRVGPSAHARTRAYYTRSRSKWSFLRATIHGIQQCFQGVHA